MTKDSNGPEGGPLPLAGPSDANIVSGLILDAAIKVHSRFGSGLLESAYREFLDEELVHRGLRVKREVRLPLQYRTRRVEGAYRLDLLVNDIVVVEVKSVEQIHAVHKHQVLTYLKLSGRPVGLLINFNVPRLVDGFQRFVHTPL